MPCKGSQAVVAPIPPQASGLTPPSRSSTPPRPPLPLVSACGPTPWTMVCPRTAPSGALVFFPCVDAACLWVLRASSAVTALQSYSYVLHFGPTTSIPFHRLLQHRPVRRERAPSWSLGVPHVECAGQDRHDRGLDGPNGAHQREMELGQCTSTLHAAQLLCLPDLLFSPPTCTPTENGTQGDPYELYKQQFDERYNGNRAPLGIFIHAAWLIADPT